MKVPCELIRDILPLYCDGICSQKTNEIIKEHLRECEACNNLLSALKESDTILERSQDVEEEMIEQEDWLMMKRLKNHLRKKQIITSFVSIGIALLLVISVVWGLKSVKVAIPYKEGNVSVIEQEGELYYEISTNHMYPVRDYKLIQSNDQTDTLYFCFYTTWWDQLFGGEERVFSTNHPFEIEKVPNQAIKPSKIYYYSGDYTKFDSHSEANIKQITEESTLIWSEN